MSTPANIPFESAQPIASTATAPMRPFYWSIHRELWEHPSIYVAPLSVAGVIVLGALISAARLHRHIGDLASLDPAHLRQALEMPFDLAAVAIMATTFVVGMLYCLDALHGERRDRSILFWKSLPVSDITTVLAKATIPFIVLPLLTFSITVTAQFLMLLIGAAATVGTGLHVTDLWQDLSPYRMTLMLLYHLVTVHVLWYAPIYGWLLFVSAWARRAPFVWAIVPPVAIVILERIVFNTRYFARMLGNRFSGVVTVSPMAHGAFPMDAGIHATPGRFLATPGLWIGLVVTALFLVAAIRLRRYHGSL